MKYSTITMAAILLWPLVAPLRAAEPKSREYIDNGVIRLGVDRESGGGIFHFSKTAEPKASGGEPGKRPAPRNVLNHHDRGRFVQQSYYGRRDGSVWSKKPWRWNPVQGGDYKGKPAKVLDFKKEKHSLYCKSIPVNWAGGQNLAECRMESWTHLHDDVAHIRYRFTYSGKAKHPAHSQEMPAVFVDYALPNLVHYAGSKPWTNAALSRSVPGWPNESRRIDENWAAFVDDKNQGIGVYTPGTSIITTYRYKGKSGPTGAGCSYFACLRKIAIEPGTEIEYHVYLTLGSVEQIRTRFAELAKTISREEKEEAPAK